MNYIFSRMHREILNKCFCPLAKFGSTKLLLINLLYNITVYFGYYQTN